MCGKDDLYDYFETVIHDRYSRLCYYFLLWDGKQEQYYYERDFSRDIPENRTEFFQFPYIRREDMFHIPSWAKDMVMYHIFPDSFATGYRTMEKQPNEQKIEIKMGKSDFGKPAGRHVKWDKSESGLSAAAWN